MLFLTNIIKIYFKLYRIFAFITTKLITILVFFRYIYCNILKLIKFIGILNINSIIFNRKLNTTLFGNFFNTINNILFIYNIYIFCVSLSRLLYIFI